MHSERTIQLSPWNRQMKSFPSLRKKIEAFEEEIRDENSPFTPNPIKFIRKAVPSKRCGDRSHRRSKSKYRKLDMGCFAPAKAKRPAFSWAPLSATKTTATKTMVINMQIATSSLPASTTCKLYEKWGAPCPFCIQPGPPLHLRSPSGQTRTGMAIGKERERREKEGATAEGRSGE